MRAELKITFIGFFVNIILVAIKLVGGVLGHSRALLADGIHSFADFLTDIITTAIIFWTVEQASIAVPGGFSQ